MSWQLSIRMFRDLFRGDEEFAVIDPRLQSTFVERHLLAASNLPLDTLAAQLPKLLPRRHVLCVLCDDDGGRLAEKAAAILNSLGYDNTAIVDGGLRAWEQAGGAVFSGLSVPGKAFGEFIHRTCRTPSIDAAELYRRQQRGDGLLLIDARSAEEHESYCIPGAVLCPAAELIYRALPAITPGTGVVVHCGGRTRGIIGAQTLIDAGCSNVHALENGTMAWQFEGLELETGNREILPEPDSKSLILTRAITDRMAERWHIDRLDSVAVREQRSRYLIDVRGWEEYEIGHIPGSINVPGGQLLQNIDHYLVVRNSIVVLIDSDWVRAITTAVWLRRMGWRRVYAFTIDAGYERLETGAGDSVAATEDRHLDPNDYTDHEALMRDNRAYLEWEIDLINKLSREPAAPYIHI